MTVKSGMAGVSRSKAHARSALNGRRMSGEASSQYETEILKRLPERSVCFVACAPGRLDVFGASAEYTGSLIVNWPIAQRVYVAVQPRKDKALCVRSIQSDDAEDGRVMAISALSGSDGVPIQPEEWSRVSTPSGADRDRLIRCVVGTLAEVLRTGLVPRLDGGLSIVVGSAQQALADIGGDAALIAALTVALAGVFGVTPNPPDLVALCQRVDNAWLGNPVGIGDAACALLGEANALTQVRDQPYTLGQSIPLPEELLLVGIDSGAVHPEAAAKYARVRTTAFMGRALIDRIIQHEGSDHLKLDGCLANVSVNDYVERFRDRLPTRLAGRQYLDRFGETGDPLTRVEPDCVYKIRSRTEHHIYEHMRACQFVECLSRFLRNPRKVGLQEAGELMYASHWSYGQRCGLGSIETDRLVNLIRCHGTQAGVYGAKITGRGCGGVVAVLMSATDQARDAVTAAVSAYESQTGHHVTWLQGSSSGALVQGVRKVSPA